MKAFERRLQKLEANAGPQLQADYSGFNVEEMARVHAIGKRLAESRQLSMQDRRFLAQIPIKQVHRTAGLELIK